MEEAKEYVVSFRISKFYHLTFTSLEEAKDIVDDLKRGITETLHWFTVEDEGLSDIEIKEN